MFNQKGIYKKIFNFQNFRFVKIYIFTKQKKIWKKMKSKPFRGA